MKNLSPSECYCMRSLSCVRDDITVILTTEGRKNLYPKGRFAGDSSHRLWRVRDNIKIPRRTCALARNDSGATEEHLRPMMHHCFTNKGQLHGKASMPAFIGPHGTREKEERGRGLFERSEFRSPRRRPKQRAGTPDNRRATFLGYFFAAGKK